MTGGRASVSRRRSAGSGYSLAPSNEDEDAPSTSVREPDPSAEALLTDEVKARPPPRGNRVLRYSCYALHALLVALHVVLVGMLFTHPERRFTVSINNTAATIALKVFLQAFYTIYTAILVLMTRRLAIAAAMSKPQSLTAVHDINCAWNGIGAAIATLWQQTKVVSAPAVVLSTLIYLSAISALHIVSSSVIQFEPFNNTVTTRVASTLAWPPPSVNLSDLTWGPISPTMTLWPLLSTAKGLSGSVLYDVPSSDYIYTGAVVNATNITAQCGLLPNVPGASWNSTLRIYTANISGLGEVALSSSDVTNLVSYLTLGPSTTSINNSYNNYIGYRAVTGMELGNLTNEVIQVTTTGGQLPVTANLSITSYYVVCTLNATSTNLYLPMQDGRTTQNLSLPVSSQPDPWTVWSPSPATELTRAFNAAQNGYDSQTIFLNGPLFCQEVVSPITFPECLYTTPANVYINHLLGVEWVYGTAQSPVIPSSPITLGKHRMENVLAQMAATFVWLAATAGSESGGFQQTRGESVITNVVLELRLNVNIEPVNIALVASLILLAVVVWRFHGPNQTISKTSVTSSGLLELMWISAQSTFLQDLMKRVASSIPDHLRLTGMKAQVCLADLAFQLTMYHEGNDNTQPEIKAHASNGQEFAKAKFIVHCLCYALHALLLALHVVLILLMIHHPEHHVTLASDSPKATIALSISLQAFYTLYTAGLVFLTQQLAVSAIIAHWHYLTAVHDITEAWSGIGAAVYALWQQTKIASSIWTLLGVSVYLACISVLHIASTTIMEFIPFNSTSIIHVQSAVSWPNTTVLANGSWAGPSEIVPPSSLLANIQTVGLLNNTLYDIVNTADPTLINATVNATSLHANCQLMSNLTYSANLSYLNFSIDGLGYGSFPFGIQAFTNRKNQIVSFSLYPSIDPLDACPSCSQYLFFLITTDVELDQSVPNNTLGLGVDTAAAGDPPLTTYLAACSLAPQAGLATLDLQTTILTPSPIQPVPQSWKLLSPEIGAPSNLTYTVDSVYSNTAFGICPDNGFVGCSMRGNSSVQNDTVYTLRPNQLQQAIEESVAAMIWIGGQVGPTQGGFDRTIGESQVVQVITKWRLNINEVPVIFASVASLILFITIIWFTGVPSSMMQPWASVSGTSLLETLWITAHSQALQEHIAKVEDPSLDNLRKAGMFQVRLGDIRGIQGVAPEGEALLE